MPHTCSRFVIIILASLVVSGCVSPESAAPEPEPEVSAAELNLPDPLAADCNCEAMVVVEENYFDPYVKEGNSILRAIHYPPITAAPKGAVRAAAHGDINLITLLMGAQGSGLEVKNRKGELKIKLA